MHFALIDTFECVFAPSWRKGRKLSTPCRQDPKVPPTTPPALSLPEKSPWRMNRCFLGPTEKKISRVQIGLSDLTSFPQFLQHFSFGRVLKKELVRPQAQVFSLMIFLRLSGFEFFASCTSLFFCQLRCHNFFAEIRGQRLLGMTHQVQIETHSLFGRISQSR